MRLRAGQCGSSATKTWSAPVPWHTNSHLSDSLHSMNNPSFGAAPNRRANSAKLHDVQYLLHVSLVATNSLARGALGLQA